MTDYKQTDILITALLLLALAVIMSAAFGVQWVQHNNSVEEFYQERGEAGR